MIKFLKSPVKALAVCVIAGSLCVVSTASFAGRNGGLYQPASKGSAQVKFGGQSSSGGTNAKGGLIKKRKPSKYYTQNCLKPGPVIRCSQDGKCKERPKPAVCAASKRDLAKNSTPNIKDSTKPTLTREQRRAATEAARKERIAKQHEPSDSEKPLPITSGAQTSTGQVVPLGVNNTPNP